ncbi:hypothetical protein EZV62_024915 [Acer yangbiense]|uniref:Uncharacterized protein n=1 Tax=Acer yangbiense TaxID=1000413 RepID=A0A5C7GWH4_9ROSI|nr:hypothetical protein EZV62_024915 [Acer yangbiense]
MWVLKLKYKLGEEDGGEVLSWQATNGYPSIRPDYAPLGSSLLYAFNCASSENVKVVFICKKRRLESKPPYLSQGIDPSSDVFQRIQMKYVDDDEGIRKYFAAFHLYDEFPIAVVVDDFGDFFHERSCQERYANPRGRDLAMVRTLALCHNAITHAIEKGPCKLLLSDTHYGNSPRLLFIYKRWISTIFTVEGWLNMIGYHGKGAFRFFSQ